MSPAIHTHFRSANHRTAVKSILFAVCLIPGTPFEAIAQERIISLTNGCALPGATAQIEIRLSEVEGLAGADLEIAFDPDEISILDVTTTTLTEDFFISFGTTTPGKLRVSMASAEGLSTGGAGAIATVTLVMDSAGLIGTRTALLFREARWYTEESVRQGLLGDNSIFEAGAVPPAEDGGIMFSIESCQGSPGSTVSTDVWISLPAGVSWMEGNITFDPSTLLSPSLNMNTFLSGWSQEVQYTSGQIHFIFSGISELNGPDPVQVASCEWTIAEGIALGSQSVIAVSDPHAENLDDFGYLCLGSASTVVVEAPQPTPTPTETIAPTATPTPEPLLVNHWEEY